MAKIHVMDHPLINHKTSLLRMEETTTKDFRELVTEITMLLGYEATKDLELETKTIKTPLCETEGQFLKGENIAIIPILRAGMGMVEGMLALVPDAKVGHVGMARNEETHEPEEYYCKLPQKLEERKVFVVDPMLATGGSAIDAINLVKEKGGKDIIFMCLLAAPEGIEALSKAHPDVDIYISTKDERLNENAYILPGVGDAGDRLYGTK